MTETALQGFEHLEEALLVELGLSHVDVVAAVGRVQEEHRARAVVLPDDLEVEA